MPSYVEFKNQIRHEYKEMYGLEKAPRYLDDSRVLSILPYLIENTDYYKSTDGKGIFINKIIRDLCLSRKRGKESEVDEEIEIELQERTYMLEQYWELRAKIWIIKNGCTHTELLHAYPKFVIESIETQTYIIDAALIENGESAIPEKYKSHISVVLSAINNPHFRTACKFAGVTSLSLNVTL